MPKSSGIREPSPERCIACAPCFDLSGGRRWIFSVVLPRAAHLSVEGMSYRIIHEEYCINLCNIEKCLFMKWCKDGICQNLSRWGKDIGHASSGYDLSRNT